MTIDEWWDRLEARVEAVDAAETLLMLDVWRLLRAGHADVVYEVTGWPVSTAYRKVKKWRTALGIDEDGRSLRSLAL